MLNNWIQYSNTMTQYSHAHLYNSNLGIPGEISHVRSEAMDNKT